MILLQVTAAPDQLRQLLRKVYGVLASAAANLKNFPAVGEQYLNNLEDRMPVVIASGGIRFDKVIHLLDEELEFVVARDVSR